MFRVCRRDYDQMAGCFTIKIENVKSGSAGSAAAYRLDDTRDLWTVIGMLNDCDKRDDRQGLGVREANGSYRGSKPYPVPRSYFF